MKNHVGFHSNCLVKKNVHSFLIIDSFLDVRCENGELLQGEEGDVFIKTNMHVHSLTWIKTLI